MIARIEPVGHAGVDVRQHKANQAIFAGDRLMLIDRGDAVDGVDLLEPTEGCELEAPVSCFRDIRFDDQCFIRPEIPEEESIPCVAESLGHGLLIGESIVDAL